MNRQERIRDAKEFGFDNIIDKNLVSKVPCAKCWETGVSFDEPCDCIHGYIMENRRNNKKKYGW